MMERRDGVEERMAIERIDPDDDDEAARRAL
jgi:hypothetical protein